MKGNKMTTTVIKIDNSKQLPLMWTWATAWDLPDAIPVYERKYGHQPSVVWQLGNMFFYPIFLVCPVCYQQVDKLGPCEGCR